MRFIPIIECKGNKFVFRSRFFIVGNTYFVEVTDENGTHVQVEIPGEDLGYKPMLSFDELHKMFTEAYCEQPSLCERPSWFEVNLPPGYTPVPGSVIPGEYVRAHPPGSAQPEPGYIEDPRLPGGGITVPK